MFVEGVCVSGTRLRAMSATFAAANADLPVGHADVLQKALVL
jgi:hypothetical protein